MKKDKTFEVVASMVRNHFKDKLIFAAVFGSRARMEHSEDSDIDLLVVHKLSKEYRSIITDFQKDFSEYQSRLGLKVDFEFLGEYISIEDLEKSIEGFGFTRKGEFIIIEKLGSDHWNAFNQHRQWLASLSTPNIFIVGNKKEYKDYQNRSFRSSILLMILANYSKSFSIEEIKTDLMRYGKEYLGFCNSKITKLYLNERLPKLLEKLAKEKLLTKRYLEYIPNNELILKQLPRVISVEELKFREKFLGINTDQKTINAIRNSVDVGLNFILEEDKVLNYYSEDKISERFTDKIPTTGCDLELILDEYRKKILNGSVHQSSPNYLAFPDSGNATSAIIADVLIAFTNQNLIATTKSAPTATFVEIQVIQWLRELIGYKNTNSFPKNAIDVGGIMTSSGTQANAIAMLAARCKSFPESREKGLSSLKVRPILIVAADTLYHYSHIASFWWLGLGEENIVHVDVLDDYRLDCVDLDNKLKKYNNGITSKVVAVVSQAGDSRTTTIENFKKVAEITQKHNVWLHVDGCHGGVLIFSKLHKERMNGVEFADSISIDPHKSLCIPYPSSAILFKNNEDLGLISKSTDITIQKGSYDLGQITPFVGSRPFDSLKLWFLIKSLGVEGISHLVEYRYNLAKKWHTEVNSSKFFTTLNNVELNSVVFSVSPDKIKNITSIKIDRDLIGKLNKLIHDRVYREGYLCIHTFDIYDAQKIIEVSPGKLRVLGVTFGNPYTSYSDFKNNISYLDKIASELINTI